MISILVTLLLGAIVLYVVYLIVGMINLPAQIKNIVYIIIAVIVLLWLLQTFGLYSIR
jgi:hypothetical protein